MRPFGLRQVPGRCRARPRLRDPPEKIEGLPYASRSYDYEQYKHKAQLQIVDGIPCFAFTQIARRQDSAGGNGMNQNSDELASATVRRWQLTETLKQLREQAGYTIDQAVTELYGKHRRWSRPKLSRIENRQQGVKPRDVEQLLDLYRADPQTRAHLLDLAETVNERGWWLTYRRDLPEDFHPLFNLEIAATEMREFETLLIPGLLQTGDYARAVITGIEPDLGPSEVDRRVAARLARQQILSRATPPELHIILDESIISRPVGGPNVMRGQLRRLIEAAQSPNVTVQLLPIESGAHPGLGGPFTILSLPEPIPDIGYTEGIGGSIYMESVEGVRRCTLRFGSLTHRAMSPDESLELISSVVDGSTDREG